MRRRSTSYSRQWRATNRSSAAIHFCAAPSDVEPLSHRHLRHQDEQRHGGAAGEPGERRALAAADVGDCLATLRQRTLSATSRLAAPRR
jgi:hypothetical protein